MKEKNFFAKNEEVTNILVVKAIWGIFVLGWLALYLLNVFDYAQTADRDFYAALLGHFLTFLLGTAYWWVNRKKPGSSVKYVLMAAGFVGLCVICINIQRGFFLTPLWFWFIGLSVLYYNQKITIIVAVLSFIANIYFIIKTPPPGLEQVTFVQMVGNPLTFFVSAYIIIFIVHKGKNFINIIIETQNKSVKMQQELLETQMKWNQELEANVNKRTRELQEALHNLKNTQEMLVHSEKMSALGGLVAGVAHEINTPIGIAVTTISHLEEKSKEMVDKYEAKKLKKSELEKYLKVAREEVHLIDLNLQRASELIRSFKKVAVDQSTEEKRWINVKEYMEEILLSLRPKIKKSNVMLLFDCPDNINITSYPGALSQLISNLVMNSLIHAFEEGRQGEITINIQQFKNKLYITYHDNGKGMQKETVDKIFDPFFTTNRAGGGTGLGMHIVYNIVSNRFNGKIKCCSEPGSFTVFVIEMPL